MTRIDFYLLQDVDVSARLRFACRLAAKAIGAGQHAYLHVADETCAKQLDELLWAYPERRMIPHGIVGTPEAAGAPVIIGYRDTPETDAVLVNLAHEIPGFFPRFERVAEIVLANTREDGRTRYKYYRDRGYPLFHHQLEEWET